MSSQILSDQILWLPDLEGHGPSWE